jgi:hypothetical protein
LQQQDHRAADQVGQGTAERPIGGAGHGQGAESVEDAFGDVVVEPVRGGCRAEDRGLGQDAGDEPVDVIAFRGGGQGCLDRAAEDVQEHEHEHDGLDGGQDQHVGQADVRQQVRLVITPV